MFKFIPLGGAVEVGANCFYLNISGTGIILDCGIHPQKIGLEALPEFDLIDNEPVDFVLISHAHQDHLGALPYLVKKHPYIRIISTPQTRAIAELTLHNSVSILKQQLKEEDELEVYTHDEIDLLIQSIDYRAYNETFELVGYNHNGTAPVTAAFYDAGHILGSAGICIEYGGEKLFYSGDVNLDRQALLAGADFPETKIDSLILETTYGGTDSSTLLSWHEESLRLAASINKTIIDGGSVLIPVFSLGKMQELLTTIWLLMQRNKIIQTEIYTGGLADKISRVYDYNRYVVNMIDKEFELSSILRGDLYEIENIEKFFKSPCIILAASGMMIEGTASYNLARRWLKQSNSAIFTVGYMEENTPGYKFSNSRKGDKICLNGSDIEVVKCNIERFRFTSHSRREGLLEIVKKLKPDNVILVHGDSAGIDWMGSSIIKNFSGVKVFVAEKGKEIML